MAILGPDLVYYVYVCNKNVWQYYYWTTYWYFHILTKVNSDLFELSNVSYVVYII